MQLTTFSIVKNEGAGVNVRLVMLYVTTGVEQCGKCNLAQHGGNVGKKAFSIQWQHPTKSIDCKFLQHWCSTLERPRNLFSRFIAQFND